MQLSDRAKLLIPKARIVSFASWEADYSPETVSVFQAADDQGRYLSDEDFSHLVSHYPHLALSVEQARLLRDKAAGIVDSAREQVITQFPAITQPKGDLYPPPRAEACWRDFWHFLRCISYGTAAQKNHFTSAEGLENMRLLYQELQVPLYAMVYGLRELKMFSLEVLEPKNGKQTFIYFDHLIDCLEAFQST